MTLKIVQAQWKLKRQEKTEKDDKVTVVLYAREHWGDVYLKAYFGGDSKHADFYVLAVDDGKPVLIPSTKEDGGYKVAKTRNSKRAFMNFMLENKAVEIFPEDVKSILIQQKTYAMAKDKGNLNCPESPEFRCRVDKDLRIWIGKTTNYQE